MKITREDAMAKMREAFPKVSDDHFKHAPIGSRGLLLCLEALGLIEIVESKIETVEVEGPGTKD